MSRPFSAQWLASAALAVADGCQRSAHRFTGVSPTLACALVLCAAGCEPTFEAAPERTSELLSEATAEEATAEFIPEPTSRLTAISNGTSNPAIGPRLSVALRSFDWHVDGETAVHAPLTKTWVMSGPGADPTAAAVWRSTRSEDGRSLRITGPHGVAVYPEVHHAIALRFSAGGAGSLSVAWRDEEPDFDEARRIHGLDLPASNKSRSVLVSMSDLWGRRDAPNVEDGVTLFEIVLAPASGTSLVTIGLMSELDGPDGRPFLESRVRTHAVWRDGIAARVPGRMSIDVEAAAGDRLAFGLAVLGSDAPLEVFVSGSGVVAPAGPFRCEPEAGWLDVSVPLETGAGRVVFEVTSAPDPGALLLVGSVLQLTRDPTDLPDVLLYLEDTLRADRLGSYGYGRATDPHLQQLARQGTLFERAFAPSNWTRASVSSLMTSLVPPAHGAVNYRTRIPRGLQTLAEVLRDAGYLTVALITNHHAGVWPGLDQGYDVHADPGAFGLPADSSTLTSQRLHPVLLDTLDAYPGVRLAVVAHSIDPHAPYQPPEALVRELVGDPMPEPPRLSSQDLERWKELGNSYDSEILHNDHSLAALDKALALRGRLDDTLFLFTSDHGEGFGEHGFWEHQNTLYQEEVSVPLVVRWPGHVLQGRRLDEAVSLVDVAPTVLGLLKLDAPAAWQGRDHSRRLLDADAAALPVQPILIDAVAIQEKGSEHLIGVVQLPYKLIMRVERGYARPIMLFDLVTDSSERRNLLRDETLAEHVASMRAWAQQQLDAGPLVTAENTTVSLGPAMREWLKALGYLE